MNYNVRLVLRTGLSNDFWRNSFSEPTMTKYVLIKSTRGAVILNDFLKSPWEAREGCILERHVRIKI